MKTAMDDSSDFQDTKKSITGPKNVAKKTIKPKKPPKKIKGQGDIRKVLRSKNELETYSKDFDKVCKKAGIDVDPEQLQLAIALSKSLQTGQSTLEDESSSSKTTQERVGKIRSTLLEYGFQVPEIKITGSKKLKNYRKKYKLLQTSQAEKEQIIANKYSKILLEDNTHQSLCSTTDYSNFKLYQLATCIPYEAIRNNDIFYLNLVQKSSSSGNLLRDWSEIPGRPVSPKLSKPTNMNFSEIDCTQDEVDIVLSGSLRSCKDLIKKKAVHIEIVDSHDGVSNTDLIEPPQTSVKKPNSGQSSPKQSTENNEVMTLIDPICTYTQYRSCSPDIFDDDLSAMDNSKNPFTPDIVQNCEGDPLSIKTNKSIDITDCVPKTVNATIPVSNFICTNKTKRVSNDFMEMTECIEIKDNHVGSQLSQNTNVTKRKSNDFMEITSCVGTTAITEVDCNIDLTQIPEENEGSLDPAKVNKSKISDIKEAHIDLTQDVTVIMGNNGKKIEDLDLTQSSNSSDDLPEILLSNNKTNSADNTILIDPKEYENTENKSCGTEEDILDLTQFQTGIECVNPPKGGFFEEFVHDHSDNSDGSQNHNCIGLEEERIDLTQSAQKDITLNSDIDLTQSSDTSYKSTKENVSIDIAECDIEGQGEIDLTQDCNNSVKGVFNNDDIDLTQKSDSSESSNLINSMVNKNEVNDIIVKSSQRYSSLGKKDDISIDYDEVNNSSNNKIRNSSQNNPSSTSFQQFNNDIDVDLEVINDDMNYYCSQHSEVFQISDKELDYSLNKSKLEKPLENFQVGGISTILNDLSKVASFRKSASKSICGESLIIADYGSDSEQASIEPLNNNGEISPIKHKRVNELSTPQKASSSGTLVETPNNTKFVIKTNDVTPMPHYETMSTPEIHRELDKYGIKPFKRKRAIQLLSHIYNQTHPVIEYSDDTPSPAKKQKFSKSPKKRLTPKKLITSPKAISQNEPTIQSQEKEIKELQNDKDVVYEVTNDPVLKEVTSNPEDWVFQKREKAKVHSCRLPLHVAFHNYVTSRQGLHEAILCYQPVNIDVIHKDLVRYGYRYDPKDLLKFLDKKCITVKTTDNDTRNNRR